MMCRCTRWLVVLCCLFVAVASLTSNETLLLFSQYAKNAVSNRSLVYHCSQYCGGIGDRLRGIVTLFYFAVASRRQFFIDMPKPIPFERVFQPAQVDWRWTGRLRCQQHLVAMDDTSTLPFGQLGGPSDPFGDASVVCVTTNARQILRVVASAPSVFGFDNASEGQYFGEAFRHLFQLSGEAAAQLREMERALGLHSHRNCTFCGAVWPDQPWLAVHYRVGVTGAWDDPLRDGLEFSRHVSQCALAVRRHRLVSEPNAAIYVASDSHIAKERITRLVDGRMLPIAIAHTDRSSHTADGQFAAWVEFALLTRATCIVASESGFSQWAAWASLSFSSADRCLVKWRHCDAYLDSSTLHPSTTYLSSTGAVPVWLPWCTWHAVLISAITATFQFQ